MSGQSKNILGRIGARVGTFMYESVYGMFGTDDPDGPGPAKIIDFDTQEFEPSIEYHRRRIGDKHTADETAANEYIRKVVCTIILFIPAILIFLMVCATIIIQGVLGLFANLVANVVIHVVTKVSSHIADRKLKSFIKEHK